MTRDDIIRLARGVWSAGDVYIGPSTESLERFAALVAAAEREEWIAVAEKALEALELRTQTVRVADEGRDYKLTMSAITALRAAIRARGET
jgi:hypothetical protein